MKLVSPRCETTTFPLKILIMGLPEAGKTTLSNTLAPILRAVRFNADEIRANINKDLGFSLDDRIEQSRRMGWLCDRVVSAGHTAIADFVCPTEEARAAFNADFTVWVNRIDEGRFPDTNRIFVRPTHFNIQVLPEGSAEFWAQRVHAALFTQLAEKAAS